MRTGKALAQCITTGLSSQRGKPRRLCLKSRPLSLEPLEPRVLLSAGHPRFAGVECCGITEAPATSLVGSAVAELVPAATEPATSQILQPMRIAAETVTARRETDPTPSRGDTADDPSIWVNPVDRALSTIIGTDKSKRGGLHVYDLSGHEIQFVRAGKLNNVDIRYDFPLGAEKVALVTATNRTNNSIAVYKVDPATRHIQNVAARTIKAGIRVYGSCMYHSPTSGKYYVYVNSTKGRVEQWEMFDDGTGRVDATRVRSFAVGSETEGCVADDELARFYISEERVGIWSYGAEPGDSMLRRQVDTTKSGHLKPDVEGLALYYGDNGAGYLIASSQGSSTYAIYRRDGVNDYVGSFEIVAGGGVDAVEHTDGIDVLALPLGPEFPQGIFVAQDGKNDGAGQNFKLVPWESIATALKL